MGRTGSRVFGPRRSRSIAPSSRRLLNGELPNGIVLKRGQEGKHQPGWDLTFSAPKSVSLLALVGEDSRVMEAHNEAVTEALRYLEATTAQARIKQDGKTTIETTGNWIIARFNHDTSRELDPQLHTHAVVINATRAGRRRVAGALLEGDVPGQDAGWGDLSGGARARPATPRLRGRGEPS